MPTSSDLFFAVQDYEVMGTGGRRRYQLETSRMPIELIRHDWRFLPGLEEETIQWLKPARVTRATMPDQEPLLARKFDEIFSAGAELLGDLKSKILTDYLREMPWTEGLLDDHFRYFALFLKRRFPQNEIWSEVFQCEWIRWSRLYENHAGFADIANEKFELNASFQVFSLGEKGAAQLKLSAGLYACVYSDKTKSLSEVLLTPAEARLIDWIEDDSGFSRARVQSMMENEGFSVEKVREAIAHLQSAEIVR